MKFYCGIDLSARNCHVCVIDEQLKVTVQQKLRNELPEICRLLAPYKANLKIGPARTSHREHVFCVATTELREARRFMVSPFGCLVQFTHSRKISWLGPST
jgi:uncharacterized Fe-S cluster-containing protein